jgi:hypothetical protein
MTKKTSIQKAAPEGALSFSEDGAAAVLERVIASGDLSRLTPEERNSLYVQTCSSLGLNPMTRPFEYVTLQGKMVLYARKDATDQLRAIRDVSVSISSREKIGELLIVTARATIGARSDESIGAVALEGLRGNDLANAYMKAETKSKRRVTLSICGLGFLDETEVADVGAAPMLRRPAIMSAAGPVLGSAPVLESVGEIDTSRIDTLADELEACSTLDDLARAWPKVSAANKRAPMSDDEKARLQEIRDRKKSEFATATTATV